MNRLPPEILYQIFSITLENSPASLLPLTQTCKHVQQAFTSESAPDYLTELIKALVPRRDIYDAHSFVSLTPLFHRKDIDDDAVNSVLEYFWAPGNLPEPPGLQRRSLVVLGQLKALARAMGLNSWQSPGAPVFILCSNSGRPYEYDAEEGNFGSMVTSLLVRRTKTDDIEARSSLRLWLDIYGDEDEALDRLLDALRERYVDVDLAKYRRRTKEEVRKVWDEAELEEIVRVIEAF